MEFKLGNSTFVICELMSGGEVLEVKDLDNTVSSTQSQQTSSGIDGHIKNVLILDLPSFMNGVVFDIDISHQEVLCEVSKSFIVGVKSKIGDFFVFLKKNY